MTLVKRKLTKDEMFNDFKESDSILNVSSKKMTNKKNKVSHQLPPIDNKSPERGILGS